MEFSYFLKKTAAILDFAPNYHFSHFFRRGDIKIIKLHNNFATRSLKEYLTEINKALC